MSEVFSVPGVRQSLLYTAYLSLEEFPGGSDNKESPGLIPGSGRSPGKGNGNPLQHSYVENSMDRGA